MNKITIGFGLVLVVYGIIGYTVTGSISPTALIPSGFGLLLIIFGLMALKESLRKHAMHGAVLVGILGVIGSIDGVWKSIQMMMGTEFERSTALHMKAGMSVICLIFVVLCVNSFIQVRKNKV